MKKIIKLILFALALIPIIWLLIFFSYVIRVGVNIGRIPKFDNPQSGLFYSHFQFTGSVFNLMAYSALLFLSLLLTNLFLKKNKFLTKRMKYIWLIGIIFVFILVIIDPMGLFEWFVD